MTNPTTKRPRLTAKEKEAVGMVLDEFLAGHDAAMLRSTFGLDSEKEAAKILDRLYSATAKLAGGP